MLTLRIFLTLELLLVARTECANILFYTPVSSYSHGMSMRPLSESLAEKGHNVTFLFGYDIIEPHPKVYDYAPKKWKEMLGPWEQHIKFFDVRANSEMWSLWFEYPKLGVLACETFYSDPEFIHWLKSSTFDLIILDPFNNDCGYGIVHFKKSKLVVYGTTTVYSWFPDAFGLPDESSSVTDFALNFPRGKHASFFHRFAEAMQPIIWTLAREYWFLPNYEEVTKRGLGLDDIPRFVDIEKNASLLLLTSHYSYEQARSLPPNVIPIGGILATKNPKPISKDLEDFINKGRNGFIFISFGTVAEFTNFSPRVRKNFINAIGNFPHIQFIWKCSYEIEEQIPTNVLVTKWAPQQSLLADSRIRMFISHTGMGSTVEAIQHVVPFIALPILSDQDLNADSLVSRKAAIKLEITTLEQQEMENAINEILNNPKYRQQMERISKIFNDRPISVLDNAVWWIEYILRHDNTNEFLRSPSVELSWWVRRQIDVWISVLFLIIVIISLNIFLIYVIVRQIFRSCTKVFQKYKTE